MTQTNLALNRVTAQPQDVSAETTLLCLKSSIEDLLRK